MTGSSYPLLLWPPQASGIAADTDHLILAWTALAALLIAPVFIGMTWFAIHFREGRPANRQYRENRSHLLEFGWILIPFSLTLVFFVWGARIFDRNWHAPANSMEISAIGRQWMWKFEHPGGQSEINTLHVPIGQPILINEISQDVIHSLYIPAMRVQMETLPDRYTQLWFKPDRVGVYHLYCSEYCGTSHSRMGGFLYVMAPRDYQAWLAGSGSARSLESQGKRLFSSFGCAGCHLPGATVRAPSLAGVYGRPIPMLTGGTVLADDTYIRDKILDPDIHRIAGYKQVMPAFRGKITEEDLIAIIAFIKSLGADTSLTGGSPTP